MSIAHGSWHGISRSNQFYKGIYSASVCKYTLLTRQASRVLLVRKSVESKVLGTKNSLQFPEGTSVPSMQADLDNRSKRSKADST